MKFKLNRKALAQRIRGIPRTPCGKSSPSSSAPLAWEHTFPFRGAMRHRPRPSAREREGGRPTQSAALTPPVVGHSGGRWGGGRFELIRSSAFVRVLCDVVQVDAPAAHAQRELRIHIGIRQQGFYSVG